MSFYGVPKSELKALYEALTAVVESYARHQRAVYFGDNLLAACRNLSFMDDAEFSAAFAANDLDQGQWPKRWRLHTYCWAARSALAVPDDFVECGVYKGFYAAVLAEYLNFAALDKAFYLYDSFAGLAEEWSAPEERQAVDRHYDWDGTYDAVRKRFEPYPNIHVIRGIVPDILDQRAPEEIAFLHIDLNAAAAEVAALERLAERVADGGIILMDDYGRQENVLLYKALRQWWLARGVTVLELPTGQGMVIKRAG